MIHGAGAVCAVKTLENIFAFFRRERIAGRFYAQHTFVVSGFLQLYADGTWGGVFNGVVEKYLNTLPEMLRAAPYRNARLDGAFQRKAFFKKERLERKYGVLHQRTPVERLENFFHRAVIHPCKLQQTFHKPAHPVRHGEDAFGKALTVRLGI